MKHRNSGYLYFKNSEIQWDLYYGQNKSGGVTFN